MLTQAPTENPDRLSSDVLTAACTYLTRELPFQGSLNFDRYDNTRKIAKVPISIPESFPVNVRSRGTISGIRTTSSTTITRDQLANTLGVDPKNEKALADAIVRIAYPENLAVRWTEGKAEALEAQWRIDILTGLRELRDGYCTMVAGHPTFRFGSKAGTIPGKNKGDELGSINLVRDALVESAVKHLGEEQVREALGSARYDQLMGTRAVDGAAVRTAVHESRGPVFEAVFKEMKK